MVRFECWRKNENTLAGGMSCAVTRNGKVAHDNEFGDNVSSCDSGDGWLGGDRRGVQKILKRTILAQDASCFRGGARLLQFSLFVVSVRCPARDGALCRSPMGG